MVLQFSFSPLKHAVSIPSDWDSYLRFSAIQRLPLIMTGIILRGATYNYVDTGIMINWEKYYDVFKYKGGKKEKLDTIILDFSFIDLKSAK